MVRVLVVLALLWVAVVAAMPGAAQDDDDRIGGLETRVAKQATQLAATPPTPDTVLAIQEPGSWVTERFVLAAGEYRFALELMGDGYVDADLYLLDERKNERLFAGGDQFQGEVVKQVDEGTYVIVVDSLSAATGDERPEWVLTVERVTE